MSESPFADTTGIRWVATAAQIGASAYAIPFFSLNYADRALVLFDEVPTVPAPAPALALLTSLAALHRLRRRHERA